MSGESRKPKIMRRNRYDNKNKSMSDSPARIYTIIEPRNFTNLISKSPIRSQIVFPKYLDMYVDKDFNSVSPLKN